MRSLGHEVVTNPLQPFDVVHLNTPFPDTLLLAHWARLRQSTRTGVGALHRGRLPRFLPGRRTRLAPTVPPLDRPPLPPRRHGGHPAARTPEELISAPKYGLRAPIRVLSNGVDTDFFRPETPEKSARQQLRSSLDLAPDARVVISVGMQLRRKGILDWVEVARAMPEVTFVWFGRTDPRLLTAEVERALAGAPANALFPGYVQAEQLREAYRGADAFCFLTKEETEGIVLWEALACEIPTLVRGIPIYRDAMPDGVLTHQVTGDGPEFAGQVAEKLEALLEGELEDLTAAGRRAAEGVDLDQVAQQLQEIYRLTGVRTAAAARTLTSGA